MNLILIGMNYRTAPLEIREQLSAGCGGDLRSLADIRAIAQVREAMCLSTCNRFEVLASAADIDAAALGIKAFILMRSGLLPDQLEKCLYIYRDQDAVKHLFRVASSIDSMIMGEPQILGQVKEAYRRCVDQRASGVILNKLLHHAFRTAKRVRTETGIANNAVSVSFAAVELAKKIFGDLKNKAILLIGAGEMAELAARHLVRNGTKKIIVANRTYDRASDLASLLHGTAVELERIGEKLQEADIVISSTGASGYLITKDMIAAALYRRKNRLLFLIDIAVPRDIDPAAGEIDNVYLYNIDDLQGVVDGNIRSRAVEAEKAEAIVDEEVLRFSHWFSSLEAVPTIIDLRRKMEDIMEGEIEKSLFWINSLGESDKEKVRMLVSSVLNKVLHDPITGLKEASQNSGAVLYIAALRKLFKLDGE
ncbi:MAG: glutamyl-tRNA reductase [Syntrophales bacterium]